VLVTILRHASHIRDLRSRWFVTIRASRGEFALSAALVTGGFALLVALLGLVAALVTGRRAANASKQLELLRHELQEAASQAGLLQAENVARLSVLSDGLSAIQILRDELQRVIVAVGDSLSVKNALPRLSDALEEVVQAHARSVAPLGMEDQKVFHRAKNAAMSAYTFVERSFLGIQYASQLDDGQRRQLSEARGDLCDLQNQIRDIRTALLSRLALRLAATSDISRCQG
jgi:hypothetical protein